MKTTVLHSLAFVFLLGLMTACAGLPKYGWTPVPGGGDETNPAYDNATIAVDFFPTYATLASPTLSQSFTEALRDIFQSQSKYNLIDKNGDINLKGSITGYTVKPVAIQSSEVAASNRLTITVKVEYTDRIDEEKNFEQTFSRFADFDSNQSLSAVEDALITEINDQLVQDIFNRTLGDW